MNPGERPRAHPLPSRPGRRAVASTRRAGRVLAGRVADRHPLGRTPPWTATVAERDTRDADAAGPRDSVSPPCAAAAPRPALSGETYPSSRRAAAESRRVSRRGRHPRRDACRCCGRVRRRHCAPRGEECDRSPALRARPARLTRRSRVSLRWAESRRGHPRPWGSSPPGRIADLGRPVGGSDPGLHTYSLMAQVRAASPSRSISAWPTPPDEIEPARLDWAPTSSLVRGGFGGEHDHAGAMAARGQQLSGREHRRQSLTSHRPSPHRGPCRFGLPAPRLGLVDLRVFRPSPSPHGDIRFGRPVRPARALAPSPPGLRAATTLALTKGMACWARASRQQFPGPPSMSPLTVSHRAGDTTIGVRRRCPSCSSES